MTGRSDRRDPSRTASSSGECWTEGCWAPRASGWDAVNAKAVDSESACLGSQLSSARTNPGAGTGTGMGMVVRGRMRRRVRIGGMGGRGDEGQDDEKRKADEGAGKEGR